MRTALIDIGSNTIRLVIYERTLAGRMKELDNIKVVARLRKFIQVDGNLATAGIQLLTEHLILFKDVMAEYKIDHVHTFATAALRQAKNKTKIIKELRKKTGITIDLLSEEEEAYFGFLAVAYSMSTPSAVTVDVGGGSTEITLYENKKLQYSVSFPFGTISLKKDYVRGEWMTLEEREKLNQFLKAQFNQKTWLKSAKLPVIGIGGSARNIGKICQNQFNYPAVGIHHYELKKGILADTRRYLDEASFNQLKRLDGLSSDRADIITIALEVFYALMQVTESSRFQISKFGLRDGFMTHQLLINGQMSRNKNAVYEAEEQLLLAEYGRPQTEANLIEQLAISFYKEGYRVGLFERCKEEATLLRSASRIYALGEYIELDTYSTHTFHLIAHQSLLGLTHKKRIKLALIAAYKNKKTLKQQLYPFKTWFSKVEIRKIRLLGSILRFVYGLNISKRKAVKYIVLSVVEAELEVEIFTHKSALAEIYQASRQVKHLEKVFKMPVHLSFYEEGTGE